MMPLYQLYAIAANDGNVFVMSENRLSGWDGTYIDKDRAWRIAARSLIAKLPAGGAPVPAYPTIEALRAAQALDALRYRVAQRAKEADKDTLAAMLVVTGDAEGGARALRLFDVESEARTILESAKKREEAAAAQQRALTSREQRLAQDESALQARVKEANRSIEKARAELAAERQAHMAATEGIDPEAQAIGQAVRLMLDRLGDAIARDGR